MKKKRRKKKKNEGREWVQDLWTYGIQKAAPTSFSFFEQFRQQ